MRSAHASLLLAFALAGCATPRPPAPPEPAPRGQVSGEVLVDPAAPAAQPAVDEVHEAPVQHAGNPPPEYPPALLRAGLPPQEVRVRVVVDAQGRVARVDALDDTRPPADAFLAAVRAALAHWRFEPFVVIQWGPGPDRDGDGEPEGEQVVGQQARPFRFDMRFRFEVVDGVARVSS